jgi:hypothetical protein
MSNFHAASASTLQFTLALVVGGELRFGATLYLSALGIDLISSLLPCVGLSSLITFWPLCNEYQSSTSPSMRGRLGGRFLPPAQQLYPGRSLQNLQRRARTILDVAADYLPGRPRARERCDREGRDGVRPALRGALEQLRCSCPGRHELLDAIQKAKKATGPRRLRGGDSC